MGIARAHRLIRPQYSRTSISVGPGSPADRFKASCRSSAVSTLTAGTPLDVAIAHQSIVGRSVSIIAIA